MVKSAITLLCCLFIVCYISGLLTQTVIGFEVGHSVSMSSGSKIPFDRIKTNVGGGWSNTSHTFTAPTDGLYYFTLGIMTDDRSSYPYYATARIMRGNAVLRYVLTQKASSTNGRLSATGSVLIKLNKGHQVHAERGSGTVYSNGNLYTHFVGFLIGKPK